jgi:hypothetical protein
MSSGPGPYVEPSVRETITKLGGANYRNYGFLEALISRGFLKFFYVSSHGTIIPDLSRRPPSFVCPPNTCVVQTGGGGTCYLVTSSSIDARLMNTIGGTHVSLMNTLGYFTGHGQVQRDAFLNTLLFTIEGEQTLNKVLYLDNSDIDRNRREPNQFWGIYTLTLYFQGPNKGRCVWNYEPYLTQDFMGKTASGAYTQQETLNWLVSNRQTVTTPVFVVFSNCSAPDGSSRRRPQDYDSSLELASLATHHAAPQAPPPEVLRYYNAEPITEEQRRAGVLQSKQTVEQARALFAQQAKQTGLSPYISRGTLANPTPSEKARAQSSASSLYSLGQEEQDQRQALKDWYKPDPREWRHPVTGKDYTMETDIRPGQFHPNAFSPEVAEELVGRGFGFGVGKASTGPSGAGAGYAPSPPIALGNYGDRDTRVAPPSWGDASGRAAEYLARTVPQNQPTGQEAMRLRFEAQQARQSAETAQRETAAYSASREPILQRAIQNRIARGLPVPAFIPMSEQAEAREQLEAEQRPAPRPLPPPPQLPSPAKEVAHLARIDEGARVDRKGNAIYSNWYLDMFEKVAAEIYGEGSDKEELRKDATGVMDDRTNWAHGYSLASEELPSLGIQPTDSLFRAYRHGYADAYAKNYMTTKDQTAAAAAARQATQKFLSQRTLPYGGKRRTYRKRKNGRQTPRASRHAQ